MIYAIFAITLLFLLNSVHGNDVCHLGSSHRQTMRGNCHRGGCAVVSFQTSNGAGVAEYRCLSDVNRHPAFATLACEHSTVSATCFDQWSNEELPANIRRLGVMERTYGEVLRKSGIERFCCCRGDYCNSANDHIKRHFDIREQPRPRNEEESRPHHHRHNEEPSFAFSTKSIALSTLFMGFLAYF